MYMDKLGTLYNQFTKQRLASKSPPNISVFNLPTSRLRDLALKGVALDKLLLKSSPKDRLSLMMVDVDMRVHTSRIFSDCSMISALLTLTLLAMSSSSSTVKVAALGGGAAAYAKESSGAPNLNMMERNDEAIHCSRQANSQRASAIAGRRRRLEFASNSEISSF